MTLTKLKKKYVNVVKYKCYTFFLIERIVSYSLQTIEL